MKRIGIFFLLFGAAFLGVLAALKVDKIWSRNTAANNLSKSDDIFKVSEAQFAPAPSGAPFDFKAAAKKINPSVVSVDKSELIRDFWSDRESVVASGTGSGVIISEDGYIITNNHVIENAASITVRLSDNRAFPAKIIGRDPRTDLAVIQVSNVTGLKPAEMGDSSKVEVGQWVMAVGNPLGYSNTLSVGVVSSLNRTLTAGQESTLLTDTIQTDAAINSGNSGGALTDDRGRLIGINSAIATPSGGSVGIGFSIPVNRAKSVVAELLKFGRVRYGEPGLATAPIAMSDPRAQRYVARATGVEPPKTGLIIYQVLRIGPAARAGLRPMDIILEVDNKKVNTPVDLNRAMLEKRSGDSVNYKVWSEGKTRDVTLKLEDLQAS